MDDLLALFEENPPEEPQAPQPPTTLDDSDDDDETTAEGDAASRSVKGGGEPRSRSKKKQRNGNIVDTTLTTCTTASTQQQPPQKKNSSSHNNNHISCAVDSRVDIRMKNRKISSIDLLDMISAGASPPYYYHSPASLAAMSLAQLNTQVLLEPAAVAGGVVDMARTVQGKTNIMTVGIVFSNSTTRIAAASGNAFCILTIGTLRTGPAVSLLLFGSAYGQHVKQCKPGMVIAVFAPKLVPPKQGTNSTASRGGSCSSSNGDTAITFSLNDARQISIVAESEDYAVCLGRVRGKNEAGIWVSDAKPCRTVVDKRVGLYCPLHRGCQQQQQQQSNIGHNKTIKMQALRLESSTSTMTAPSNSERRMILPHQDWSILQPQTKYIHAAQGNNKPRTSESMLADFQARQSGHGGGFSSSLTLTSLSQNRLLSASSNHQRQTTAGLQRSVVGKSFCLPVQQQAPKNNNKSILNPYSNKQVTPNTSTTIGGRPMGHTTTTSTTTMMMRTQPSVVHQAQKHTLTQRGGTSIASTLQDLQNILQPPMKRGAAAESSSSSTINTTTTTAVSKRPRKANVNTVSLEGFNGSVVVPKPRPIFAATASSHATGERYSSTTSINSSRTQQLLQQPHQVAVQASAIRAKQQQMAARLRETQQQQQGMTTATHGSRNKPILERNSNTAVSARDSLFGAPLDDAQREQLLQAKSQFADEARSEEYARSRKVVVELQKQEEKKNRHHQSGNNMKNNSKNGNTRDGSSSQKAALIQKQWHCRTCGKSYPQRPRVCERANHRVVLCREIQKQKSTAETRLVLSNKDACDGGLKLGSGIEWSGYSRFS